MTDISIFSAVFGGIQQGLSAAQAILQLKTSTDVAMKVSEVIDRLTLLLIQMYRAAAEASLESQQSSWAARALRGETEQSGSA